MSGGEQQMLALARAYVAEPRSCCSTRCRWAWRPMVVDEIFEFLGRLRRAGVAMLLVEQYVTRALELADYVYLLQHGAIAFAGEPAELDRDQVFAHYVGAGPTAVP